jgi:hypothetical protein
MQELQLDPGCAISRGSCRLVFQHPRHTDRVIKVMLPRFAARMRRRRGRFGMSGQFAANKLVVKEVVYLLHLEARRPDLLPLFPWIHGLVRTNLGLGLVCEKIAGADGAVAPSLRDLARTGLLTQRHRALARSLCDAFARDHIVVNDLHAGNIVAEGPLDRPRRLVIIDGFGDPNVPPVRRLSSWWNRFAQRKRLARLRKELGLPPPKPHETSGMHPGPWAHRLLRGVIG